MAIFKRGKTYYYNFWWEGQHIQCSTKQGNPRVARQIEAAHKTALAKGEAGIFERKPIPYFAKAMEAFLNWSEHEHKAHPRTHQRYVVSSKALLKYSAIRSWIRSHPMMWKAIRLGEQVRVAHEPEDH